MENIRIRRVVPDNYSIGVAEVKFPCGNSIQIYDIESAHVPAGKVDHILSIQPLTFLFLPLTDFLLQIRYSEYYYVIRKSQQAPSCSECGGTGSCRKGYHKWIVLLCMD